MPAQLPGRRHAPRHWRATRHGWPLAASVTFAVIALAGAVVLVTHQPGRAGHRAGAAGRQPAMTAATACARHAAASPCPPPQATADHPAASVRPPRPARRSRAAAAARHRRAAAAHPAAPAAAPRAAAATTPPPRSTRPASTAPPVAAPGSTPALAIQQVLALINTARGQAGLAGYTITSGLGSSAGRHNAVMAAGCGLSHQCPGEPALGARETAAGVHWTAAGENIGEGGPVADTPAAIAQMAAALTQSMLNEKPPDDGHRLNILSGSFTHIGISVYRDSSGTVWMTQDFAN